MSGIQSCDKKLCVTMCRRRATVFFVVIVKVQKIFCDFEIFQNLDRLECKYLSFGY